MQLEGAHSGSSLAVAAASSSLTSHRSCLLSQLAESKQLVMGVTTAVFNWLFGMRWHASNNASAQSPAVWTALKQTELYLLLHQPFAHLQSW
jgi:hypothetical protein